MKFRYVTVSSTIKNLLYTLLVITGVSLTQSCITIRINDDGSRDLKENETAAIVPFNLTDVGQVKEYASQEQIQFQEVNAEDLKEIKKLSKKTWIYLWGSWCKPCIAKLPKLIELDKKDDSLNIIFVSEDYYITELQRLLHSNNYNKTPYLLDSKIYGSDKSAKPRQLKEEFLPEVNFDPGFPQNYVFNRTMNSQIYKAGLIEEIELQKIDILMK